MDDKTIIGLYLNRDQEAIRCTEALYGRRLFSLAQRILENDQDAEESVSDTYWQAWNTIPPQKPRYFFAYLAKICRNFAFKKQDWKNAGKRKAEMVALTQEMENCIPDAARQNQLEARELGRLLDAFLRQQTEENRLVFIRRFWYGDTIGEIAARYGIGESAVRMRLNRTKSKLSEYLQKEGIGV